VSGAGDLLVTGTDTGVGKTVIAAALVLAWRSRGVDAVGFKPVETGLDTGAPADSAVLAEASGRDVAAARPLLRLLEPLAPAVAAERAGAALDPTGVEGRVRALRSQGCRVVVEGAGGALVPLAWGYTVLDLGAALGLEAVVVGRAGLGTLNHVMLTLEALGGRGIPVRGVVLNGGSPSPDLAESTNPGALARLAPGVRVVVVPREAGAATLEAARSAAPLVACLLPLLD
jgi:dethiobiotin synthetase